MSRDLETHTEPNQYFFVLFPLVFEHSFAYFLEAKVVRPDFLSRTHVLSILLRIKFFPHEVQNLRTSKPMRALRVPKGRFDYLYFRILLRVCVDV